MNNPVTHNLMISLFVKLYSTAIRSKRVQVNTHSKIYTNTLNHSNKFILYKYSLELKFDLK